MLGLFKGYIYIYIRILPPILAKGLVVVVTEVEAVVVEVIDVDDVTVEDLSNVARKLIV